MSATATVNKSMHGDKTIAGALALAMHVLFIVLLVFGVSWQKKYEAPVEAELWSSLPPLPQPKVAPPPEPEPPKPTPKVEAPLPKVEPKPVVKPDIALKKKEVEKKKPEPPKVEPKKLEDDKAAKAKLAAEALAKKKREEERDLDLKKFIAEKEADAKAAEQRAAAVSAQDKLAREYIDRIRNKVRSMIIEPPGLQGIPEAEFDVVLIPGGEVLNARLRKSSGVPAYDAAVERAIMKAQPLPLPPDPAMFSKFRELRLVIRPK